MAKIANIRPARERRQSYGVSAPPHSKSFSMKPDSMQLKMPGRIMVGADGEIASTQALKPERIRKNISLPNKPVKMAPALKAAKTAVSTRALKTKMVSSPGMADTKRKLRY